MRKIQLEFHKYQGAGNDFVVIDNRDHSFQIADIEQIKRLCDRRFGIGADGLMCLQAHPEYDFEMLYFNADGKPGSMCGNGGRCIVAFAKRLGIIDNDTTFLAVDGPHYAKISDIGVDLAMRDLTEINRDGDDYVLNTGSPHYIQETKSLSNLDVFTKGKSIRNSPMYKADGINVNFFEPIGDVIHVRTYERGVEDETFACGTGVTAVAIAVAVKNNEYGKIVKKIKAVGGDLEIRFERTDECVSNIFLCGPAEHVFSGTIQ